MTSIDIDQLWISMKEESLVTCTSSKSRSSSTNSSTASGVAFSSSKKINKKNGIKKKKTKKSISHLWETAKVVDCSDKWSSGTRTSNRTPVINNSLLLAQDTSNEEELNKEEHTSLTTNEIWFRSCTEKSFISKNKEDKSSSDGIMNESNITMKSKDYNNHQQDNKEKINGSVVGGDSDDDSDEEDAQQNHHGRNIDALPHMRLQRMISLMQSEHIPERIQSLKCLHDTIYNLHVKIKEGDVDTVPPELDFPPPYDLSRIALTHNQQNALVSDLAKGKHVKTWSVWQRTKASVTEQFLDNKKEQVDEGGDYKRKHPPTSTNKYGEERNDDNMSPGKSLQTVLDCCASTLFRRLNDASEICRLHAINCLKLLFLSHLDTGKHLGFLMPVVLAKYPCTHFDEEMNVFVDDFEKHQFYKRGGAIERQDREHLLSGSVTSKVVDSSEEIRLAICELLRDIIRCFVQQRTSIVLDAYFTDIILAIQSHLKDPFPMLKITASNILIQILRAPRWEIGAKVFAIAISRAAVPNMRHRNSKVRISAIKLFEASVSVPNRQKIKGAGTEAIIDLIGFREENVLPIAAFYKHECGVTVNTLAELATDKAVAVRLTCCQMLVFLINCLPDRYDHQTRLLPYLLNFLHDENEDIRISAGIGIDSCGEQYESEHPNEIIERRQYGVDGDLRCNHIDALPFPFTSRPRLGTRLFVRSNTRRLFVAVLAELTSWVSKTGLQSAKLLTILVVYFEEHVTMDFHDTILGIVKAVQHCKRELEKESTLLLNQLVLTLEIMGRFVEPQTYIKMLLSRATGDIDSSTTFAEGGTHSEASCVANTLALGSMIRGTLPNVLLPYTFSLISKISSSLGDNQLKGTNIIVEMLLLLQTIFQQVARDSLTGAQTACFDMTGRIQSSQQIMTKCQSSLELILKHNLCNESIVILATQVMEQVSRLVQD